jgi:Amt family ammonium transporter
MAIKKTIGFRITEEQEDEGMDLALHAESAYEFNPSFGGGQYIEHKSEGSGK